MSLDSTVGDSPSHGLPTDAGLRAALGVEEEDRDLFGATSRVTRLVLEMRPEEQHSATPSVIAL